MTNPLADIKVDSREGIEAIIKFARAGNFVLNRYHEQLAFKYGVPIEGVRVSRLIPIREERLFK